jgi:hypothetical protein
MAIRFRCPFCTQRLGIGSRKAGTVVECPKCHGQVTVPRSDGRGVEVAPPRPPAALFERLDLEEWSPSPVHRELSPVATAKREEPAGPVPGFPAIPKLPQPEPLARDAGQVEPVGSPAPMMVPSPGILLSSRQAAVLTVVVIVLLGLAFAAGLVVGRYVL